MAGSQKRNGKGIKKMNPYTYDAKGLLIDAIKGRGISTDEIGEHYKELGLAEMIFDHVGNNLECDVHHYVFVESKLKQLSKTELENIYNIITTTILNIATIEKMKLYKIKASVETVIAAKSQENAYTLIRNKRLDIKKAVIESIENCNGTYINLISQIEDYSELPYGWESNDVPVLCDEPQNLSTVGEILSQ